jgi:hypothetical protein
MPRLKIRRFLATIVLFLLITITAISLTKEMVVSNWIEGAFEKQLNLKTNVGEVYVDLFQPQITLDGLYLKNEPSFGRHWLANINKVTMDYDPARLLKKSFDVNRMRVDILEVNIVKNLSGALNLNLIKKTEIPANKSFGLHINKLYLNIRRVTYQDFTRNIPVRVYDLNIKNAVLRDVNSLDEIAHLVAVKIFERIGVGQIGVTQDALEPMETPYSPIERASSFVEKVITTLREAIPA